jgi:transposase-like protein
MDYGMKLPKGAKLMEAISCKHCGSAEVRRDGKMRGKQRYSCRGCQRTFTLKRRNEDRAVEKALAVLLYGTGKASFRYLARLFNICPATAMNWVRRYVNAVEEPEMSAELRHVEIDEMWHFLDSKKTSCGSSRPLIAPAEELLRGLQASGTLQR